MSLVITSDYITPATLTGYVREALKDQPINDLALIDNLLPDTLVDDVDFRADTTQHGLRRAGKFRAWDTEAPITSRKGISRISGELPPLSEKRILGEYQRLKMRKADKAIQDAILNDAVELADALRTRMIIAKAQALVEGKVSLAEDGLEIEADFQRHASHTVTASTAWSSTADPIADQESWFSTFRLRNGGNPVRAICSQRVMSALMKSDVMRAYCLPPGSTQGIVRQDEVNALFTSFGHPALEIFDAQVEDADGNAVRLIPDDSILYIGAAAKIGETLWGTTAEAIDPAYALKPGEAPGIVVGSYRNPDPSALWTKASGIGLPILVNANATMIAKVL